MKSEWECCRTHDTGIVECYECCADLQHGAFDEPKTCSECGAVQRFSEVIDHTPEERRAAKAEIDRQRSFADWASYAPLGR